MWIRQVFLRASMRLVYHTQVLEPSEGDTKKRRVESFDESVDWFQREMSSKGWMTNVSDEREIIETDVGDPLESHKSFCRDSSVWL